jgi:hypothetical protein
MADLLYVANGALDMVGQGVILSLEDNTPAAKSCALHVRQAVRETLALGKWKSAQAIAVLAQLTDAPAFGWSYQYQLPNDYLRMVAFNDDDSYNKQLDLYDIQGTLLLTEASEVNLTYIKDLSANTADMGQAHPLLIELMVVKLAQKLAWPRQQSKTLRADLMNEFTMRRRAALAADAQETRKVLVSPGSESTWLRRRGC